MSSATEIVEKTLPADDLMVPSAPRRMPRISTFLYGLGVVVILFLCAFGNHLSRFPSTKVIADTYVLPGATHWFGTDSTGMDVFSRTVAGFRYDVVIGLGAAVACTLVGMIVGVVAAVAERSNVAGVRVVGGLIVRILDLLQALPAIIIGLVLVAFFGANEVSLILAMVVALSPNQARLVRSEVLRVSGEVFLENAAVSGESGFSRTFRYILPNAAWPALENATLVFASAIGIVAGLGFLGVGLAPPTPEWGSMISTEEQGVLVGKWWPVLFPSVAMLLTTVFMVALNRRIIRHG
ncbi:ABC transporter permease [Frondihabitans australicus]|uniref:Peptide/nickel transport system permease protein n=1 Tax=Frondihabitans australicus TaxID=386892 RepID=A0A495IBR5_9MICO|nr:ABC transporter permease [Frondihabitans australicus]RKR73434.1 peptide/nickel transport system permease protein [Frondihabitans australicus]